MALYKCVYYYYYYTEFCADRSNRCGDMAVYNFSRWRLSAILDFKKVKILSVHALWRAKMHHRAKFCANRSRRFRDMAVFRFFKMAAIRHLGFLKVQNFNGSYPSEGQTASSCQFFFANRSRRCGDMAVFDFSRWRPSAILDFKKFKILTARTL